MQKYSNRRKKELGPSNRQLRVGELIRRNLADIISKSEMYDPELGNTPIIVCEVKCSADLKIATAYVMPLGGKNIPKVVKALATRKYELRKLLGKRLNLKFVPDLRFLEDTTFDQVEKTKKLLNDPAVKRDIFIEDDRKEITNSLGKQIVEKT